MEAVSALASSYALIFLAEIGDKSQLVCMTLAARYRALPVLLGTFIAFALLNLLAVVFGAGVAAWVPEHWVVGAVALLFLLFGLHALRAPAEEDEVAAETRSHHSILITAFLLIFLAEFGDKTQIAVAGLSSTSATTAATVAVFAGATLALWTISAVGALAGRTLLQRWPLVLLHRISGGLFLLLAALAGYRLLQLL